MKKYKLSLFIFTRDLRLEDNTSLLIALNESEIVIPIFIFNPEQIDNKNEYKSNNCIQFMCECLDELNENLKKKKSKLHYFYDEPVNIIGSLLSNYKDITSVYMNKDYTPFAIKREETIKRICDKKKVNFSSSEDYLLSGINSNNNSSTKFNSFLKLAKKIKVKFPEKNVHSNYLSSKSLEGEYKKNIHKFYEKNDKIAVRGGRANAIKIFQNINLLKKHGDYTNSSNCLDLTYYNKEMNYPTIATTHLSAYLKFNVISIREIYHFFKKSLPKNSKLITQLYWRDFYMGTSHRYLNVNESNIIKWGNDTELFGKWVNGKTGFPIVDAGMRQLNETGYIHNRIRIIVANFLVKTLHIDWRAGEKYFSQKLVDYDWGINAGCWKNILNDRGINPWTQSKKYDSSAVYVKRWIPELRNIDSKDIHTWNVTYKKYGGTLYSTPIFDNVGKRIKDVDNFFLQLEKASSFKPNTL